MRQETFKKSRRLSLVSMGVFMALNAHGNTVVLSQANQSSANNVNIAQTVGANQNKIAGEVVAQGMEKALLERLAVEQGVKNAEKIKQIADDSTIGKGLAQSLQCNVTANVRYSEHKIGTSSANASNQQKSLVANYALKSSANKRAERHERHKMLYCGQSEIRNGECLHGIYNKPNIDTNFSNLMAQNTMSEQEMEGAYDYLRHLVDISQTVSPECQTHECNLIRDKETQYNTYANAVQSVFLNLIHERTNPIDPVRVLKIVAIDQNPDELSGDNWRPEHGTVYPDGRNIVRGGDHQSTGLGGQCQTAEDNTPVTTNHPIIVIGDDIAELNTELNGKHNIEIYTKKGASPKDVLKMLTELVAKKRAWAEKTIKDDPQHKDKTDKEKEILIRNFVDEYWGQAIIMISTGVINDPDLQERKHIEEIVEILGGFNALNPQKGEKGSTALAGMPLVPTDSENKDVKKNQKQLPQEKRQALNDWLAQTANKHKVGFSGTFTSDDGKLPNDKRLLAVFGRGLAKNGTSLCILNADSNECLDVEETNKQDKVVVKTAQSAKKALQNCAVELAGGTAPPSSGVNTPSEMFGHDVFNRIPEAFRADIQQLMYLIAKNESKAQGKPHPDAFNRYYCPRDNVWWERSKYRNQPEYKISNRTFAQILEQTKAGHIKYSKNTCANGAIYTAGFYQWTALGLVEIRDNSKLWNKYKDQVLSPSIQSAINLEYHLFRKRSALNKLFSGKSVDLGSVMDAISLEWSSVGNKYCTNESNCRGGAGAFKNGRIVQGRGEKASYVHTQEIREVVERIHGNMKRNPTNLISMVSGN